MKYKTCLIFVTLFMLFSCDRTDGEVFESATGQQEEEVANNSNSISFLALGDSYTIGQGVALDNTWPKQLASQLKSNGFEVKAEIVARTGWTTGDLLLALENQQNEATNYQLVSLLIGVNNQYQGRSQSEFASEFELLLKKAIALASNNPAKVFVLSIPDYGVTPFAQSGDPEKISAEIDEFNEIKEEIAISYEVEYFNITDISRKAASDLSLLVSDQLHPSATMYAQWVNRIQSKVSEILEEE